MFTHVFMPKNIWNKPIIDLNVFLVILMIQYLFLYLDCALNYCFDNSDSNCLVCEVKSFRILNNEEYS